MAVGKFCFFILSVLRLGVEAANGGEKIRGSFALSRLISNTLKSFKRKKHTLGELMGLKTDMLVLIIVCGF